MCAGCVMAPVTDGSKVRRNRDFDLRRPLYMKRPSNHNGFGGQLDSSELAFSLLSRPCVRARACVCVYVCAQNVNRNKLQQGKAEEGLILGKSSALSKIVTLPHSTVTYIHTWRKGCFCFGLPHPFWPWLHPPQRSQDRPGLLPAR